MNQMELFGTTKTGQRIDALTLQAGALRCRILTLGATLQALWVPDRAGRPVDVVLGYDTPQEYLDGEGYFGATVGRYANRIARGHFCLNGQDYSLACNDGENHLHGGRVGFSHRIWHVVSLDPDCAVLTLDSPDGEEGYPGNLHVELTYRLHANALELQYSAACDRDTLCNLTNHSYFNLGGHDSGPVLKQLLQLEADAYTPVDPGAIPLGPLEAVAGTPMDFRTPTALGARLDAPFAQLRQAGGYDHNYVLRGQMGQLRPAAAASCAETGITLQVATTLPGIQLYTANFVKSGLPGKGGAHYGPHHAFCLETQFYPDSPNHPEYPSALLPAGQRFEHTTRFAFGTEK